MVMLIISCMSLLQAIGQHGAAALLDAATAGGRATSGKLRLLTHCNTGALATAGYGTALGVVRALRERQGLEHVYCTETRPYNQGEHMGVAGFGLEFVLDAQGQRLVVRGADQNRPTAQVLSTFMKTYGWFCGILQG